MPQELKKVEPNKILKLLFFVFLSSDTTAIVEWFYTRLHLSPLAQLCYKSVIKLKTPAADALWEVRSPVKTPAYLKIYNFENRIELSIPSSKCLHPYYY